MPRSGSESPRAAAMTTAAAAEHRFRHQPDDLLEPAAPGHVSRAVHGRDQRREARAGDLAPGGKLGKYTIKYVSLDDSTAQNPGTGTGPAAQNARKAVQDKSTIVYLGEFNSGASTISIPILNQAGIPQISPSNTDVGLTTNDPGAEPGEPQKYYPTGKRTYARVVPRTHPGRRSGRHDEGGRLQGRHALRTTGGLRRRPGPNIELSAKQNGLTVQATQASTRRPRTTARWRPRSRPTASCVGRDRRERRAGVQGRRPPRLRAPSSTAPTAWPRSVHEPEEGRHPGGRRRAHQGDGRHARHRRIYAGRPEVLRGLQEEVRRRRPVDPYAIYGYETMALGLDAIKRAGDKGNDRKAVIDAAVQRPRTGRGPRHVLDRQERRHDDHRLRPVHDQGRQARRSTRRSWRTPADPSGTDRHDGVGAGRQARAAVFGTSTEHGSRHSTAIAPSRDRAATSCATCSRATG